MKICYTFGVVLLLNACMHSSQPSVALYKAATDATAVTQPSKVIASTTPPATTSAPLASASTPDSLADRTEVQIFIAQMVNKHGFDSNALRNVFNRAYAQPEIIALITRPAEAKPWYAYRDIFLTNQRIQSGLAFWRSNEISLAKAERLYGVPAEIIVAIIGVETTYGGNTGKYRVLEALSTLAFDYPKRADYFRKELENYLLLTREEGIDPLSLKGSYAGAMGLAQFMPSSYLAYAVDFDGDGQRGLWVNPRDAIGSVANYLSKHRWQSGEPVTIPAQVNGERFQGLLSSKLAKPSQSVGEFRRLGVIPQGFVNDQQTAILLELDGNSGPEYWLGFDNFYVITRYNQSPLYAMAVYQLSQEIRGLHES
jgi:membrane-bound lytic murein transglycosylase B